MQAEQSETGRWQGRQKDERGLGRDLAGTLTALEMVVRGKGAKDDLQASSFWYWMDLEVVH